MVQEAAVKEARRCLRCDWRRRTRESLAAIGGYPAENKDRICVVCEHKFQIPSTKNPNKAQIQNQNVQNG